VKHGYARAADWADTITILFPLPDPVKTVPELHMDPLLIPLIGRSFTMFERCWSTGYQGYYSVIVNEARQC
jgi:hypothetical protein